jgi:hypothetical protein
VTTAFAISRRATPLAWEATLSAAVAAAIGIVLVRFGPPAGDLAAHAYLRTVFLRHGFTLWDNFSYAGRFTFLSYSVLYYPLAALVGIKPLAVATVAVAGFGFTMVLGREWGSAARLASWTFAVVWACVVLAGTYPFALGAALALLGVLALQARHDGRFALLALLTLAASPLAFLFLVLVCAGIALERRPGWRRVRRPALAVAAISLLAALIWRLFPAGGRYPFSLPEFAAACVFFATGVALTWRVERARLLGAVFAVNLAACTAAFVMPSALGENVARLRLAAVPLAVLALSLRRWRPRALAVLALALAIAWNASPIAANILQGARDRSSSPSFWQPAISFLRSHADPSYRVEVVDTLDHWEAAYLPPAGIPIARGWFRQDDFPFNRVLYLKRLTPTSYLAWLHAIGVRWVVLTTAPPDYSARDEAALLRTGRSGLRVSFSSPTATVYAVPRPRPIVTGPGRARVLQLREARLVLWVGRPGTYRVAVRFAPYWQSSSGCVTRAPDGTLSVSVPRAGQFSLNFDLDSQSVLDALAGTTTPRCSR